MAAQRLKEAQMAIDLFATDKVVRDTSAWELYKQQLQAIVDDAYERKALPDLVDVLAYSLARIAVDYDAGVIGNILERMGCHITGFADRMRAEREAEREVKDLKERGQTTH